MKEATGLFYDSIIVKICDDPDKSWLVSRSSIQGLPSNMKENIKHVKVEVQYLGSRLGRIKENPSVRSINEAGQTVDFSVWDKIHQLCNLETIDVRCSSLQELQGIAIRFATNTSWLSEETEVIFKAIQCGPLNTHSEIGLLEQETFNYMYPTTEPTLPFIVPAVKAITFSAFMPSVERKCLERMDYSGHRLKKVGEEATKGLIDFFGPGSFWFHPEGEGNIVWIVGGPNRKQKKVVTEAYRYDLRLFTYKLEAESKDHQIVIAKRKPAPKSQTELKDWYEARQEKGEPEPSMVSLAHAMVQASIDASISDD